MNSRRSHVRWRRRVTTSRGDRCQTPNVADSTASCGRCSTPVSRSMTSTASPRDRATTLTHGRQRPNVSRSSVELHVGQPEERGGDRVALTVGPLLSGRVPRCVCGGHMCCVALYKATSTAYDHRMRKTSSLFKSAAGAALFLFVVLAACGGSPHIDHGSSVGPEPDQRCEADASLPRCVDPSCKHDLYAPGWCIADTCTTDDDCKAWNGLWCDLDATCVESDGCTSKGWCVGKRPTGAECDHDAQCCSNSCWPDTAPSGEPRCRSQQVGIVASC